MTFIRPSEYGNIWRLLFVVGGFLLAGEMMMLIYLYNQTVNLNATLENVKIETQQIGAKNALLGHEVVLALDGTVRSEDPYRALVEDAHPEYLNLHPHTNAEELYVAVH